MEFPTETLGNARCVCSFNGFAEAGGDRVHLVCQVIFDVHFQVAVFQDFVWVVRTLCGSCVGTILKT